MGFWSWLFGKKKKAYTGQGWVMDEPDFRDNEFRKKFWSGLNDGSADLRGLMPPVVDQGSLGSCVPCSLAAMVCYLAEKEVLDQRSKGTLIPIDEVLPGPTTRVGDMEYTFGDDGEIRWRAVQELPMVVTGTEPRRLAFSRMFLYYEGRRLEGKADEDAGMQIRSGLKALAKKGVCIEKLWPYRTRRFAWKPRKAAYEAAERFRIRKYWRLKLMADVRTCLDDGYPVALGMTLYDKSWAAAEKSGVLEFPGDDERPIGGHCVVIVGYDDVESQLLCRNSMGTQWGLQGHFNMPYAYLDVALSMWTIRP